MLLATTLGEYSMLLAMTLGEYSMLLAMTLGEYSMLVAMTLGGACTCKTSQLDSKSKTNQRLHHPDCQIQHCY